MVVIPGAALTFGPLMELKPVAGLQVYDVAPLALRATLSPEHEGAGLAGLTVTVGVGLTVTVMVCVALQPLELPVTV
jgi:hypothetical protein